MSLIDHHAHTALSRGFYADADLDFQTRGLLGRAVRGATEVGEVLATVGRIKGHQDWAREWSATASQVETEAARCGDAGRLFSASSHYLRAASYWAAAVDGLTTGDDEAALLEAFRCHRRCWDAFIDTSDGAHLRVDVPYEATTLPGYLLRPDATGARRPTLVITNGSDGSVADLWTSAAAGALARGWNAFVYDGPGQQSVLFEQGIGFRPDWEAVLTPVVDTLVARDDVDAESLTGYGISQAGYWLTRALADEHRLRAAAVDPGVVDVSTSWTAPLTKGMRRMLADGDRDGFNKNMGYATKLPSLRRTLVFRSRPYAHTDWYDLYRTVQGYAIDTATAERIDTPLLITAPEDEQFWPGQSEQLAAMLPGEKSLVPFGAEDGAPGHCQPTGRLLTELIVFDWLESQLARLRSVPPTGGEGVDASKGDRG